MAKNGNGKRNEKGNRNENKNSSGLKIETKHGIIAVIFFVLALLFLMSKFSLAGPVGVFVNKGIRLLLGVGDILLFLLLLLLGVSFIKSEVPNIGWTRVISGILFLLPSL